MVTNIFTFVDSNTAFATDAHNLLVKITLFEKKALYILYAQESRHAFIIR